MYADKMTFPMDALWHEGYVYTASPPHIWRLSHTDDDGVADERKILVSEFGFTGNAADIHGCFLGPDGRIPTGDGRHGHNFTDADGKPISKGLRPASSPASPTAPTSNRSPAAAWITRWKFASR